MNKRRYISAAVALIILSLMIIPAVAASTPLKTGIAYLLDGSTVYADDQCAQPLYRLNSKAGVYVLENVSGSNSSVRNNDVIRIGIVIDGKLTELYVYYFDLQYMTKKERANYAPGSGAVGVYGIVLGSASITQADAPKDTPNVTTKPRNTEKAASVTEVPQDNKATPRPNEKKTATPAPTKKKATPAPTKKPTPTPTEAPVFAAFIAVEPIDTTGVIGEAVTLNIQAENVVSYQWQYKTGDFDWKNLPNNDVWKGSRSASMTFTALEEYADYLFRCIVNGTNNTLTSAEVRFIADKALRIVDQPRDQVAADGSEISFSVYAVNASTYHWQMSVDENDWTDIAQNDTALTDTLKITAGKDAAAYKYRCVVTGLDAEQATTQSVSLKIGTATRIITQPENAVGKNGGTIVFHVEAENAVSYQWQYDDGISGWWDLVERDDRIGTMTDTLTLTVRPTVATFTYRCVITGVNNVVETKAVSVSIK